MRQDHDSRRDSKEIRLKVAEFPEGVKDVADLLNTPGGAEAFGAMIRNAKPGPSWMIENVGSIPDVSEHDLTTLDGKVDAAEDLVDILLHQHPIAREKYVKELADRLKCSEAAIKEMLDETLQIRQAYYQQHPQERPWRRDNPNGEGEVIRVDIV